METCSLSAPSATISADLSPQAAAQLLAVSRKTVLALIRSSRLPAYPVGAGDRPRYRIRYEDLTAFRSQLLDREVEASLPG